MKRRVRLILTGGGVKGAFQAGFISNLLHSNKYDIDAVYATSVGAILAPLVTSNKPDVIQHIIDSLSNINDIVEPWPWYYFPNITRTLLVMFKKGRYKSIKIIDSIWKSLTKEEQELAASKCRIVAWDINNRRPRIFGDNGPEELYHGIKASCALWLLVPPYKYNYNCYCDGGAGEIFPLDYILDQDKNYDGEYILIDCSARYIVPLYQTPKNALELMYELQWVSTELLAIKDISELKRRLGDRLDVVYPCESIFTHSLEVDKNKLKLSFLMGREKCCDYMISKRKIEVPK